MLYNQLRCGHRFLRHLQNSSVHARAQIRLNISNDASVKEHAAKACNYTIEEVTIPVPSVDGGAFLAGQLWRGESNPSEKVPPPILCAHGLLDNAGSFAGLLPLIMKPNMTALCIDFPGQGLSSHLTTGHYDLIIDCCKSLYRAYRHLNTSKVILVGHSMGAISCFLFAAVYPEYADRLISIDAHAFTTPTPVDRLKFLMDRQLATDEKLAQAKQSASFTYEKLLEKLYLGRVKGITMEGCKNLLERGAKKLPDGKYVFSYDIRAPIPCSVGRFSMVEVNDVCAAIKCPVTWIKAEPGDAWGFTIPFEYAPDHNEVVKCLKKYNDNLQTHVVPGSHFVHINNPDIVAPIISSSLGF